MKCAYHACGRDSSWNELCADHELLWAKECRGDYEYVSSMANEHGHVAHNNGQFSVRWSAMIDLVLELES